MSTSHVYNNSSTKARRRELRKRPTDAERRIWTIPRSRHMNGLKFIRQYSVGPYFLDFFCPQRRLAIEVDGGQHAEDGQRTHDEGRTSYLKNYDIRVLRFWNNEVLANPEGVAARISEVLDNPSPPLPPLRSDVSVGLRTVASEVRGGEGELAAGHNPSQPPLTLRGGVRHGFTLFELLIVVAIFVVMSGMLLSNFRRSRLSDVTRIAAFRFASDVARMQSLALSGAAELDRAVAYGVHVDAANPRRYILFGDLVRCAPNAEGEEVCAANGTYDAGASPAEALADGIVPLASGVRIDRTTPIASATDVTFRPPRGTVAITPDAVEVRVTFMHEATGDARSVTINRISGRVDNE